MDLSVIGTILQIVSSIGLLIFAAGRWVGRNKAEAVDVARVREVVTAELAIFRNEERRFESEQRHDIRASVMMMFREYFTRTEAEDMRRRLDRMEAKVFNGERP